MNDDPSAVNGQGDYEPWLPPHEPARHWPPFAEGVAEFQDGSRVAVSVPLDEPITALGYRLPPQRYVIDLAPGESVIFILPGWRPVRLMHLGPAGNPKVRLDIRCDHDIPVFRAEIARRKE